MDPVIRLFICVSSTMTKSLTAMKLPADAKSDDENREDLALLQHLLQTLSVMLKRIPNLPLTTGLMHISMVVTYLSNIIYFFTTSEGRGGGEELQVDCNSMLIFQVYYQYSSIATCEQPPNTIHSTSSAIS